MAQRRTNWFAIWTSVAVVIVLVVLGGVVVWMNNTATRPGEAPKAANVNAETGAISFGTGPDKLGTYVDFMCEYCQAFESSFGDEIAAAVAANKITLELHPISILDGASMGTQYSSRASSAMYSVAINDPKNALAFLKLMYEKKPAESSAGLSDDEIIAIAQQAGVDMTDQLRKDITSGRYIDYVKTMTEKTPVQPGAKGIATPTVTVNGEVIANSTLPNPGQLLTLFD